MDTTLFYQILFVGLFLLNLSSGRTLINDDDQHKIEYSNPKESQGFSPRHRPMEHRSSLLKKSQTSHSRQQIVEILRQA